jgi:hypothetical protein
MQPWSCKRDFFELREGNGPPPRKSGQRLLASARTAVKEQARWRRSARASFRLSVLTLRLVSGFAVYRARILSLA